MLEPKAPPARNGPNKGSLAPGVRKRVKKKSKSSIYFDVSLIQLFVYKIPTVSFVFLDTNKR